MAIISFFLFKFFGMNEGIHRKLEQNSSCRLLSPEMAATCTTGMVPNACKELPLRSARSETWFSNFEISYRNFPPRGARRAMCLNE